MIVVEDGLAKMLPFYFCKKEVHDAVFVVINLSS